MKTLHSFILTSISVFLLFVFSDCRTDGLTKEEVTRIKGGDENAVMSIFAINVKSDSLFLRQEAREIRKNQIKSKTMAHFRKRLLATVCDSSNLGVGIAAPQVGVSVSMIYVQRFDKEGNPFEIYYNPVIEAFGDSINSGPEGCLSVPGFRGNVDRSQNISISYLDSLGVKQKEDIRDFTAIIFQHEIDHLKGMLYYDHVNNGFKSLDVVDGY